MSRNLVLTSIYQLSAEAVEPFFHSLRLSGYQDDIAVFVTGIPADCRALLLKYGVTVIDSEYRGLPMAYANLARRVGFALKAVGRYYLNPKHWRREKDFHYLFVNCWRFFCFQDYLARLPEAPRSVLLADVRDVVFQSNPFSSPFPPGLSAASECTRGTIGQSHGNKKWLWEAVGGREMRRLTGKTAVCAGTTLADHATMTKYLELMTSHFNRRFFWALFDSIDQGLHNYFVHNRLIAPLTIHTNWHGPFLTGDSEVVGPKNKNREGYLCNDDGSIIPVVHQYDRIPGLFQPSEALPPCWKFYAKQIRDPNERK